MAWVERDSSCWSKEGYETIVESEDVRAGEIGAAGGGGGGGGGASAILNVCILCLN